MWVSVGVSACLCGSVWNHLAVGALWYYDVKLKKYTSYALDAPSACPIQPPVEPFANFIHAMREISVAQLDFKQSL